MERYLDIDEGQALKLREGLELLETLDRDAVRELDLCFYGLSSDPQILDAAREAIASDSEDEVAEQDVQIGEVAVAIPISSDTIYALTGSGIKLKDEYFAYAGSGGEGTRRGYFFSASYRPTVTMHSFSHVALASSDSWVDDFLEKVGGKGVAPTEIKKKVKRTEDATQPGTPTPAEPQVPVEQPPAQAPAAPPAAPAATPKRTSLNNAAISRLVEDILG
jgi:hypothetical protein